MRINAYIARSTGLSRREADNLVETGKVKVGNQTAMNGSKIIDGDKVFIDGKEIKPLLFELIMLNKPTGYVVSRRGQGAKTIYELLPTNLRHLKPIGRLDKNSTGLLLLTNDGKLAQELSHPKYNKTKIYQVKLNHPLEPVDKHKIENGVMLDDGLSRLAVSYTSRDRQSLKVVMNEGRNRQIRRTFKAVGYEIQRLHRTNFGNYALGPLRPGDWQTINKPMD